MTAAPDSRRRTTPADVPATAVPRPRAGAAGVLAGAGALLAAELAGRLVTGSTGPVVAVGNAVVSWAPPTVRDTGIGLFGTLDKPLLVAGVLVVSAVIAATAGRLHVRSAAAGAAVVGALSLLAALAVAVDVGGSGVGGLVTGATAFVVGAGLLRALLGQQDAPPPGRREFLQRASLLGLALVAGGGVLRALDQSGAVTRARDLLRLAPPVRPAPGNLVAAELGLPGLTPVVTSNASFYRIDTALVVPQVDPETWSLSIGGMVQRPLRFTLEELLALPQVEADITLQCVSNEVGGDLVGLARWQGVRLSDLLEQAGVRPRGRAGRGPVGGRLDRRLPGGVRLRRPLHDGRARDERRAAARRARLPRSSGRPRPLRLRVGDQVARAHHPHDLGRLRRLLGASRLVQARPIKVASRIDVPADLATVTRGPVTVAGMAWAPGRGRGITRVQVRVDGAGPWLDTELADALSEDAWRQWHLEWDASPGEHLLEVRATDRTGDVQDGRRVEPRPDGATGFHAVRVLVS